MRNCNQENYRIVLAREMENEGADHIQETEEESQDSQELEEIPVQLDESSYETLGLSNSSNIVRGKYYKQTYRPAWEQMPDFKGWLRGVVGEPTRAYCTYCQKTLHAHRLSLLKHTCTIRHQKAAQIHNTRKNKAQAMEQQEIHAVVLQEEDMNQAEIDNEDGDAIEYTEIASEVEDEDHLHKDGIDQELVEEEEEEEESTVELHQVPFEKHNQNFQANPMKAPVSTHVLDTTRGCPVSGLQVSLYKLIDGRWTYINEGVTNVNGKFASFVDRADFTPGRYKLHYDVDRYFDARKQDTMYPFIEVVFDCRTVTENYHIPILLSPYGYSTYRGS
jgi:hydroxyisourate hydrolase